MSDISRITGTASGLDVDALVKQMLKADTTKVDKAKQDKQILQWKQDMYRDIITDLNTYKSTYFDVLKPDTNMLSSKNYSSFDVSSSDTSNSVLTVTASGTSVMEGKYVVTVKNLATSASITSGAKLKDGTSLSTKLSDLGVTADTLKLTYSDGTNDYEKSVVIDPSDTLYALKNAISDETDGNVILNFSELTGKLTLKTNATGEGTKISAAGSNEGTTLLSNLGLTNTPTDGINATVHIKQPDGSEADVTDEKTNSFTIDGVSYKLSSANDIDETTGLYKSTTITVSQNVDKTFDKINTFIDKYNEIVTKINTKVTEKKQYSYTPLTDDQKDEMSDTEITAWETKAKQGLLKGDTSLSNMLYNLRRSFYEGVEGAGISLTDIGLSTSSDTSQGGKIIVDETKLKDAIKSNGDQVSRLFMKTSQDVPSYDPDLSNEDRDTRESQEGIFQRVNDIFQDNVRTIRNDSGKKGSLLEKAGVQGDYTEYNNLLTNQLNDQDDLITKLTTKLSDDEDKYYNQFSKLESAMQTLNDQSNWLTSQLSS